MQQRPMSSSCIDNKINEQQFVLGHRYQCYARHEINFTVFSLIVSIVLHVLLYTVCFRVRR